MLDYEIYFYSNLTENVEVYLFDFDMKNGKSVLEEAKKLSELQEESEEDPIDFSWHDFGHTDVYLIAKKIDIKKPAFKFKIKYRFEENLGLPLWGLVVLCMIGPIAFIVMLCAGLYYLHRRGVIEVRIPKPCRCLCFKGYLSPEEKEEMRRKAAHADMLALRKELTLRIAVKPTVSGFAMDDSFFSDTAYRPNENSKAALKEEKDGEKEEKEDDEGAQVPKDNAEAPKEQAHHELDGSTKLPNEPGKNAPGNDDGRQSSSLSNTDCDFFTYNNPNEGLKTPGEVIAFVSAEQGLGSGDFILPTVDKNAVLERLKPAHSQQLSGSGSHSEKEASELELPAGRFLQPQTPLPQSQPATLAPEHQGHRERQMTEE